MAANLPGLLVSVPQPLSLFSLQEKYRYEQYHQLKVEVRIFTKNELTQKELTTL